MFLLIPFFVVFNNCLWLQLGRMLMLSHVEKSCPFPLGENSSCTLVVTPIFGCCFFFNASSRRRSASQLAVRHQAEVWPLLTDMRFVFRTCCWGFEFILHYGWFHWSNVEALDQRVVVKKVMPLDNRSQKRICWSCYKHTVHTAERERGRAYINVQYACMCASKYTPCPHFSVHKSEFACESVVFKACCHGVKQSESLADWWPPARERSPLRWQRKWGQCLHDPASGQICNSRWKVTDGHLNC